MKKNFGPKPYIYPQPVLIVSAYGEDGSVNIMNVAYGGMMNANRLQINIGARHKTSDNIKATGAFTVGIANVATLVPADYVGIVSGHDEPEKTEKSGFTIRKSEFVNAPILEELPITMECRVESIEQHEATLRIVAEIVNTCVDEAVLDANGELDVAKADIICYDNAHHRYLRLGEAVGNAFADGEKLL